LLDPSAKVEDWTTGSPALMLVHLRNEGRNRSKARQIAEKIVQYQQQHPGKPVNMVGFSGGGSMICYVLEELPPGHRIDSAVLLAPAISPGYPVRDLLSRTRQGIWNFYSPLDFSLSVVGTTLVGTMDGEDTASAGAIGFAEDEADAEMRSGHSMMPQLHQVPFRPSMIMDGNLGGHFGPTFTRFVQVHVAPLLR
jgi:pimeloyl-ACP methyl ester carboxylesterase